LVGRLRGNEIAPGDQLKVQVEGIDLQKKQADFRVIKTKAAKKKKSRPLRKPQRAAKPDKFSKRKDTQKHPKSKRRRK